MWWGRLKGTGDVKLVKKIIDWNRMGVRSKERLKNRRRDEITNDLKKLNGETGANWSNADKPGKKRTKTV